MQRVARKRMRWRQVPRLPMLFAGLATIVTAGLLTCYFSLLGGTAGTFELPADSNLIDVDAEYGTDGHDASDDTAGLQRAITDAVDPKSPRHGAILYLKGPAYIVTDTLKAVDESGAYRPNLKIVGSGRSTNGLRVPDNTPGFGNPAYPKPVIQFGSDSQTGQGGYDRAKGEGNEAFHNYLEHLYLEVGDNAGAVGVDYIGNNIGAIRDVKISAVKGYAGILLTRKQPGPALVQHVEINGFRYGMKIDHALYGLTFEDITLADQTIVGIENTRNTLAIRDLHSINSVPAVRTTDDLAGTTLVDSRLEGGSYSTSAVQSAGNLFARNVRTTGYRSAIEQDRRVVPGVDVTEYASRSVPSLYPSSSGEESLDLAPLGGVLDFDIGYDPAEGWINVVDYGANPTDTGDDSGAIQRAIDAAGASAGYVYFPDGQYHVHETVYVRGGADHFVGMHSQFYPGGPLFADADNPRPLFEVGDEAEGSTGGQSRIVFEKMTFARHGSTDQDGAVIFRHASSRPLAIKDVSMGGQYGYALTNAPAAGPLQLENVYMRTNTALTGRHERLFLANPQKVSAVQLDCEVGPRCVYNNGGSFLSLGLKTEGFPIVVDTSSGGKTEVLGAMLYPATATTGTQVAFRQKDSEFSGTWNSVAYSADQGYAVQVSDTRGGSTEYLTADVLGPGFNVQIPRYVGD